MLLNSGRSGKRSTDDSGILNINERLNQKSYPAPRITSFAFVDNAYVPYDDTALDPAGGQRVVLYGSGFVAGATVLVGGATIAVVTVIDSSRITFISPANSSGSYTVYVTNPNGGTAVLVPGLVYSGVPTFTTSAGTLGSFYETTSISANVVATGDAPITYSLDSGALPTGATLFANGIITGTAPVDSSSTTYSFTIKASDAQNQDTTRSFTITINTDVVTWSSPAADTTYNFYANSIVSGIVLSASSAAGKNISYSANSLPTGISLSGNTISGTPTVVGSSSTLLTATATTSRSATRTINWVISVAADTIWGYTSLLLSGNSSISSGSSFATDLSPTAATMTVFGDARAQNFSPYTPGYYSLYFDGSSYITTASSDYTMAGDFTIEAWVNADTPATGGPYAICGQQSAGSWFDFRYYNNQWQISFNAGSGTNMGGTGTLVAGAWTHVAAVRSGSSVKIYVNGLSTGTTITNSSTLAYSGMTFYVGSSNGNAFKGYISNFRIVNGTALYTSNFTPTTSTLTSIANTRMLLAQSNRLVDNGPNAYAITKSGTTSVSSANPFTANSSYANYGSAYFDGTGDYLTVPYSSSYNIALNTPMTFECWVYPTTTGAFVMANRNWTFGSTGPTWGFSLTATNLYPQWSIAGTGSGTYIMITSTIAAVVNQWNHVAFSRDSSNVVRVFINGASGGTRTDGQAMTNASGAIFIGNPSGGTATYANGYMADMRLVIGSCVYTANTLTPPTAPVTSVANTVLLAFQTDTPHNSSTFSDNSSLNNIITRAGNTAAGTFSPYGNNWSIYCNNNGCVTVPASANYNIGTSDFTMEFWMFPTISGTNNIMCSHQTGGMFQILVTASNTITFNYNSSGGSGTGYTGTTTAATVTINAWNHIVASRVSGTVYFYINGTRDANSWAASGINIGSYGGNKPFYLGAGGDLSGFFTGYLSNYRYVLGTGIYSGATIYVPTAPLTWVANTAILALQNNRFIDNSPYNAALTTNGTAPIVQRFSPFSSTILPTYYSTYFDGTGDYLSLASNNAMAAGTGNFTVEMWIYPMATPAANGAQLFDNRPASTNGAYILVYLAQNLTVRLYVSAADRITSSVISLKNWYHVAVVRNSGTTTMYINGASAGSWVDSTTYIQNGTYIGASYANGAAITAFYTGYISNLRFITGTAVYTGAFTPATAPLTAISGTQLLTCQSNTISDNSTNYFTVTANADAKPLAVSPFTPTPGVAPAYSPTLFSGSLYFDGTGDYIDIPNSITNQFAVSAFTIDVWVYPTVSGVDRRFLNKNGSTLYGYLLGIDASNLPYWRTDAGVITAPASLAATGNVWTHIGVSSNGTTTSLYVNGTLAGSAALAITSANETGILRIGARQYLASTPFTGYMSDIRIVKSAALYTANFVPAATPLTANVTVGSTNYVSTLLINGAPNGIVDATRTVNVESVGDVRVDKLSPYTNGGVSYYFDGTGDNLAIPINNQLTLGSGNFTIEFWFYNAAASIPSATTFFDQRNGTNGVSVVQPTIELWSANGYIWYTRAAIQIQSGTSVPVLGAWQHIAVSRSSGSTKMFVNGTQVGSTYADTNTYPSGNITIGRANDGASTRYVTGYITDFRVTIGSARYTTNFTAPTTPLLTS